MFTKVLLSVINTPTVVTLYDRDYNAVRDYLLCKDNGYIVYNSPFSEKDIIRMIIDEHGLAIYLK